MRRLTRTRTRRRLKKRGKHSRNNKYRKTRRGKYIKKRCGITRRRRVLRGGVFLNSKHRKYINDFFDSLHDDSNNDINGNGEPSYYSSYDRALFCLNDLFTSLQRDFITMLGEEYFKKKYNSTFYNDECFARLRLIKWLSYIYDKVSTGTSIIRDKEFLHFTVGNRSVIPVILALLCSADTQCLNTTNYVARTVGAEGHKLIIELYTNIKKLVSSKYLTKNARRYIKDYILPRIDDTGNGLALNSTVLCLIIKELLGIEEKEEAVKTEEAEAEIQ
jgi:hypothetical protein